MMHTSTTPIFQSLASFSNYDEEVSDYMNLPNATYLKGDGGLITNGVGLKLLYAMEIEKPIILPSPPKFASDCSLFIREQIMKRLGKIYVANIEVLDSEDSSILVDSALKNPINYLLTRHQKILLRSYIRLHLRKLS